MSDFVIPRPRHDPRETPLRRTLRTQMQVLWALILHDIKGRFFGNGWGYVVTILWPSAHIAILVLIFVLGKRPVPYGSNALLYASTGALPFIAWSYISRFTMMGMIQNKMFAGYPIIKPLDMMLARLALEHVSIFIITVGLITFDWLMQVDIVPINMGEAICGLLSAVLLGVGFGILNAVIVTIFPLWFIGYVVIIIVFWWSAGLAINPEAMPEQIGYWISWNPLMHSVEWVRKAYYADYPAHFLNKTYVVSFGVGTLALGLLLERALKRYVK